MEWQHPTFSVHLGGSEKYRAGRVTIGALPTNFDVLAMLKAEREYTAHVMWTKTGKCEFCNSKKPGHTKKCKTQTRRSE